MRVVLPLRVWLTFSHLAVLALPLIAVIGTGALAWDLRRQTANGIQDQGSVVAELVRDRVSRDPNAGITAAAEGLGPILSRLRDQTLAGFRVVDQDGTVLASSGGGSGEDLSAEPEVGRALRGEVGLVARPREPPRVYRPGGPGRAAPVRLFVAVPIVIDGQIAGAVVVNRTPREEVQALFQMAPRLWIGALLAIVLTLALGLFAGHLFSRSLIRMAGISNRIADGSIAGTALMDRPSRSHVRETRELALAVSHMAARLQTRLGYIREFAGNVSHEFKTPLSTLKGTIELLSDDPDIPPAQRDRFLANAAAEVDRMDRLVVGLLALARAEERADHEPIDADELVRRVAARHPDVKVQGRAGQLVGSPDQIELALHNVIENAERYGGADASIRVHCQTAEDTVHIEVVDDGPGISPANLPRVTQRFFTTARASGGTGLGLALVDAVCRAHGGELELHSEPGCTRVRLKLPRR